MNVRRSADYSVMFAALDMLIAENLCGAYPDASGFSPRNLRRMRGFYRTYGSAPEVLAEAMNIGWTQNVVY